MLRRARPVHSPLLDLAVAMLPVAADEDDRAAGTQQRALYHRKLRVVVDAHGVPRVGGEQVALQATGRVEYQQVQPVAPLAQQEKAQAGRVKHHLAALALLRLAPIQIIHLKSGKADLL